MNRSELRGLIREVLIESLPEIVEIISEINERQNNTVVESISKPDRSLIKSHIQRATERGYDDLPSGPNRSSSSSRIPTPNNPKGVVNGEAFASGKGIMEWFESQNGKLPIPSEFKHTNNDMGEFMKKRFGV